MNSNNGNGIRLFVILISLYIAWAFLKPSYDWYHRLNQQQKDLANITKSNFNKLTVHIEKNAQYIRNAIKNPSSTQVALTKKDQEKNIFAFDISKETKIYKTDLDIQDVHSIIKHSNKKFNDWNSLDKKYQELKNDLSQIKMIEKYQNIKKHKIKLGLDIAGGVHFVLGVDTKEMKNLLDKKYKKLMNTQDLKQAIIDDNPDISQKDLQAKVNQKRLQLKKEKNNQFNIQKTKGIDQALIKIINRVDQFGVSEPIVLKGPESTIIVELPGEKDIDNAKSIFTRVGKLSFQLVNEDWAKNVPLSAKSYDGTIVDFNFIEKAKNSLPKNTSLLPVQGIDKFGQVSQVGFLPVFNKVELSGSFIKDAKADFSQLGEPNISFSLDNRGASIFAQVTSKNTNKRLAIVLDDAIQSAPNIREPIVTGQGSISGSFSKKEASVLAAILRSGSLPVPLKIEEERIIGPSLGKQEILQGFKASYIALLVLGIFLFSYYGIWGGLSANIAQIVNLIFILAIMAQLGAALTLPGIGAIVLTIGMSVDANVIINERIKEYLKENLGLEHAFSMGYASAFRTILDSNLTTLIPSLVLSVVGDGPIRGFGITLMIGLLINLFTSIFITRFLFNVFIYKVKVKQLLGSQKYAK